MRARATAAVANGPAGKLRKPSTQPTAPSTTPQSPAVITRLSAPSVSAAPPLSQHDTHKRESIDRSGVMDSHPRAARQESSSQQVAEGPHISLGTAELWRDLLVHTAQTFADVVDIDAARPTERAPADRAAAATGTAALTGSRVHLIDKALLSLEALVEQMEETILRVKAITQTHHGADGDADFARSEENDERDTLMNAPALVTALKRERAEADAGRHALIARLKAAEETEKQLRHEMAADFAIIEHLARSQPAPAPPQSQRRRRLNSQNDSIREKLAHGEAELRALQRAHAALADACVRERALLMESEDSARALLWLCFQAERGGAVSDRQQPEREDAVEMWRGRREELCGTSRTASPATTASRRSASSTSHDQQKQGPGRPSPGRCSERGGDGAAENSHEGDNERLQPPWPWANFYAAGADSTVAPISPLVLYGADVTRDVRALLQETRANLQAMHDKHVARLMARQDAERLIWRQRLAERERENAMLAKYVEKLGTELRETNTVEVAIGEYGWESVIPDQHVFNNGASKQASPPPNDEPSEPSHDSINGGEEGAEQPPEAAAAERHSINTPHEGRADDDALVWVDEVDLNDSLPAEAPATHPLGIREAGVDTSFGDVSPYADLNDVDDADTAEEREELFRRAVRAARAAIRDLQLRNDQLETTNRVLRRELEEAGAPVPRSLVGTPFDRASSPQRPGHGHGVRPLPSHQPSLPASRCGGTPATGASGVDAHAALREGRPFGALFTPERLPPSPSPNDRASAAKTVNPTIWIAAGGVEESEDGLVMPQEASSFLLGRVPLDEEDSASQASSSTSASDALQPRGGYGGRATRPIGASRLSPPRAPTRTPSEA